MHMDTEKHVRQLESESLYDTIKKKWADKVTGIGGSFQRVQSIVAQEQPVDLHEPRSNSTRPMGWALKTTKKFSRMNEKPDGMSANFVLISCSAGGVSANFVLISCSSGRWAVCPQFRVQPARRYLRKIVFSFRVQPGVVSAIFVLIPCMFSCMVAISGSMFIDQEDVVADLQDRITVLKELYGFCKTLGGLGFVQNY
ncbi:hypothetical protein QZH41_003399 [Actinostola sp. cb2023]|nr:hypothetical protein QZH41_003399 [Actinostola sp. cb2023]